MEEFLRGIGGGAGAGFLIIMFYMKTEMAKMKLEIEEKYAHKETINKRFDSMDIRFNSVEDKLDGVKETLDRMCGKFNGNGGK